jgi:glycosyltransferase involved in cell wall biosynthesis
MRILVVTHYYASHLSGIEIIAESLNRSFAEAGHDVVWIASKPPPTEHSGSAAGRVVPMAAWNVTEDVLGFPYPLWGPVSLLRLKREIADADIIHVHDSLYMGNVYASLVASFRRKPLVVTQHIGLVPYSKQILRTTMAIANRTIGRFTLSTACQVVFYSLAVQEYFSTFVSFRQPPMFISNGVDNEIFYPASSDAEREVMRRDLGLPLDRPVVIFVGRFVEKKGIYRMADVCQALPEIHFVFVGWGPLNPASWGFDNVSVFHSQPHNSLRGFYCAADLLLLPSAGEGFPLVVQEAMACGLPCMFSRETANAIDRGHELFLLTDLEQPALISSLRRSLQALKQLAQLRPNIIRFVHEEWSWRRCAETYLSIFEDLLSKGAYSGVFTSPFVKGDSHTIQTHRW